MMQATIQNLGWIFLIIGIVLVIVSVIGVFTDSKSHETKTQSKGVILIGPIPIVWGYGRKGWMIAGVIGVILFGLWIIFFQ